MLSNDRFILSFTGDQFLQMIASTGHVAPQLDNLQPIDQRFSARSSPTTLVTACSWVPVLHQVFPYQRIERNDPILWTPRFLDITHQDIFLCFYVKDIKYQTKIRDIIDLKQEITEANSTIDKPRLQ